MVLDRAQVAGHRATTTKVVDHQTYYFCAKACKQKIDQSPEKFLASKD